MRILVLGSEGFIGSHFRDFFLQNKIDIVGLDLFEQPSKPYKYIKVSRLSPEFEEAFQQYSFDVAINAAGSGNVGYSMSHPLSDFEANCLDVIRVLDILRKFQPECRYIHLSSAAVYGNPAHLPVREEHPLQPLSPYGWHKLVSEQLCREYTSIFHLRTAIIRPFSVYGPGLKKQLFWDIHQKLLAATGKIELSGTGNESRDFIYIGDMVKAVDLIIRKGALQGECYNIASGAECTIEKAVKTFIEATGIQAGCFFNGKVREGDPLNWRADISKLTLLGFKPDVELQQGLKLVANWMQTL
jgi:UDP-glucose 4-epimerase